jgi:mono/diheme cytochrome c family protein
MRRNKASCKVGQPRRLWWLVLVVLGLAGGGCGGDQPQETGAPGEAEAPGETETPPVSQSTLTEADLPEGVTLAMVQAGKGLYEGSGICYTCHGAEGDGTQIGPSLRDTDWLHIDGSYGAIVQQVMSGVDQPKEFPGLMPPKGGSSLSDDDVGRVAAYVWSLSAGSSS